MPIGPVLFAAYIWDIKEIFESSQEVGGGQNKRCVVGACVRNESKIRRNVWENYDLVFDKKEASKKCSQSKTDNFDEWKEWEREKLVTYSPGYKFSAERLEMGWI